jgi:UDP-N-acetylmuramate--alanine ligase
VPLKPEQVRFEPSWSAVPQVVAELAEPGDLVVTLGAGDVTLIGPEVVDLLAERAAARESAAEALAPVME